MILILGSVALLILCVVRWQQLADERRRMAQERQHARQPVRSARIPHTRLIPTIEPETTAKERWIAQVVKANPGLTSEAAAILYERMADNDADPIGMGPEG